MRLSADGGAYELSHLKRGDTTDVLQRNSSRPWRHVSKPPLKTDSPATPTCTNATTPDGHRCSALAKLPARDSDHTNGKRSEIEFGRARGTHPFCITDLRKAGEWDPNKNDPSEHHNHPTFEWSTLIRLQWH